MANDKQYVQYLDIPKAGGGTERKWLKDADARAAIEILDPSSVEAKANKVTSATAGNLAGLDASGDLTDSGKKPSDFAASSHAHGNIQSSGTLQTTDVSIANGDKLVVTDASDSNKLARTSVAFDGSDTTKALTPKGTFESFSKFSGSYSDLTDKPTIPAAAANGTFSVKTKSGDTSAVTAADFTANQSSNDDITFIQGSNVTLTTDTENRTVTISANSTTPSISATATVDGNTGTPGVTVTKSGTDAAPSFAFAFTNLKGANAYKNTAGTTNKTGSKMFIVGATEQSANPQTYSNSNCYIGTDNCLYSNGTKVVAQAIATTTVCADIISELT